MPRQLNQYLHFGRYLARRFIEDNCIKNAAALTYTTLFAVVPVMTVAYAMLAAIPALTRLAVRSKPLSSRIFCRPVVPPCRNI